MANASNIPRAFLVSMTWATLAACPVGAGETPTGPARTPAPPAGLPTFAGSGYIAVKMTRLNESSARYVEMTVDGHKLRMLIDTGCDLTILHTEAAERLGLQVGEGSPVEAIGETLSVGCTYLCRYHIGDLTGGFHMVGIADLRGVAAAKPAGSMRFDGILGMDFLTTHAARLDLAADTLHLRSPFTDPGKQLAGRWVCTAVETTGEAISAEARAAVTYEFDGDQARFRTRRTDEQYYFAANPSETPSRLVLYRDAPAAAGKRTITCRYAMYELAGDTLTVCMQHAGPTPVSWQEIPKDFKPAANFAVMHFKRAAATAPLPPLHMAPLPPMPAPAIVLPAAPVVVPKP